MLEAGFHLHGQWSNSPQNRLFMYIIFFIPIILYSKFLDLWQDNANRRIPVSHKCPLGIETRSLMTGSKRIDHWTSGTVCECQKEDLQRA